MRYLSSSSMPELALSYNDNLAVVSDPEDRRCGLDVVSLRSWEGEVHSPAVDDVLRLPGHFTSRLKLSSVIEVMELVSY